MYKCEFFTKYILARTQSMDFPNGNKNIPTSMNAENLATGVLAEAEAIWKQLNIQFNTDEVFKTDIRGNIRGIQS